MRQAAVGTLSTAWKLDERDKHLVSQHVDGVEPWRDPHEPITEDVVSKCAAELASSPDEVRARYEALSKRFGFPLEWKTEGAETNPEGLCVV